MKGIVIGAAVFCAGLACFIFAVYYGWMAETPGGAAHLSGHYSLLAEALSYFTYAIMTAGVVCIVFSIRKVNKRDRRSTP